MLKVGGTLIHERKFTLGEVRFEIDNWSKVGDTLYCEPELISKRIQWINKLTDDDGDNVVQCWIWWRYLKYW